MHRFKPDFIASVTYLPTEKGGREWPVHSGYQPVLEFEGCTDGVHAENVFTDREYLLLGETATADITIVCSELYKHLLYEGQRFEIFEPPRHIGTGMIKKILNKDLEKSATTIFREMIA